MFNQSNAAVASRSSARIGRPSSSAQIIRMQATLLADTLNPKTSPADRAKCAQAWERLEERLRIIRGKPLPGMLRPDVPDKHRLTKRKSPAPMLALPELAPEDSRSSDAQKNPVRESPLPSEGGGGVPG